MKRKRASQQRVWFELERNGAPLAQYIKTGYCFIIYTIIHHKNSSTATNFKGLCSVSLWSFTGVQYCAPWL